jgi:Sec7-like guanine-nucleotide exchange factor
MAIRKLLMEVELPKETQQIDRFLQAFADRYHECNPGIFATTGMVSAAWSASSPLSLKLTIF